MSEHDGLRQISIAEYNALKTDMALRDILREMASYSLGDNMIGLITRLREYGVIAHDTQLLKRSILHEQD